MPSPTACSSHSRLCIRGLQAPCRSCAAACSCPSSRILPHAEHFSMWALRLIVRIPELVALIPSGYTPLTWATADRVSMQITTQKRRAAVPVLKGFRFTSRAELPRVRFVPMTEVSTCCHSVRLATGKTWPGISQTALATTIRRWPPQPPSR